MSTPQRVRVGRLELAGGGVLDDVEVAWESWGRLAPDGANAVLVCHALTGSPHVGPGGAEAGWWEGLIGPGRAIDPADHFVLCPNLLGSCYGTTGPASVDPTTGRRLGARFPEVMTRDMVEVQRRLLDHLGVRRLRLVIGGSLGAMVVWRWAVDHPDRVAAAVPIAGALQSSPWVIALNAVARQAVLDDPAWADGDYDGAGPRAGLALARMTAMISYRTSRLFTERFGRREVAPERRTDALRFEVESYLRHHGEKLVRRFDAGSYVALTRAMDLHDVARGHDGLSAALGRVRARVLAVGIDSDVLFWPDEVRADVDALVAAGGVAAYAELRSTYGHDAFLVEHDQLGALVRRALDGRT